MHRRRIVKFERKDFVHALFADFFLSCFPLTNLMSTICACVLVDLWFDLFAEINQVLVIVGGRPSFGSEFPLNPLPLNLGPGSGLVLYGHWWRRLSLLPFFVDMKCGMPRACASVVG
jgi:hypothetical protein